MRGWQVSAIRLNVQVGQPAQARSVLPPLMQYKLPAQAVSALATLGQSLEDSPRNAALKAAIEKLVSRHQKDPSCPLAHTSESPLRTHPESFQHPLLPDLPRIRMRRGFQCVEGDDFIGIRLRQQSTQ